MSQWLRRRSRVLARTIIATGRYLIYEHHEREPGTRFVPRFASRGNAALHAWSRTIGHAKHAVALILCLSLQTQGAFAQSSDEYFENKIRPILANRCWSCHSGEAGESKGSLRLDHGSLIEQGGDSGAAIVAGKPEESLLFQAINYQGYEMPPDGRLSEEEIQWIKRWIEQGAKWPDEPLPEDAANKVAFDLASRRAAHWAWQPYTTTPGNESGSESVPEGIDRLIRSKLAEQGLEPNPLAPRNVLIRRVYLDLIGLPPTPDELQRWMSATDPDWYKELLNELLANPQFGVRWARHWLDLVRFAQSRGHEFDEDIPSTEPYRDYVVRAWNLDLPYDQFLTEHVAGDLVPVPRTHPTLGWNESVLGTGFWHLGEWVHSPVDARKDETDRFDNMVDVFSKTFLGVTVACARCHDHKFDAISQQDYYALYGYLQSSDYRLVRFETDLEHRKRSEALSAVREPLLVEANAELKQIAAQWAQHPLPSSEDRSSADEEAWKGLAQRLARDAAMGASQLPLDDMRVHFDARRAEPWLWGSDSVIYGRGSQSQLSLSFDRSVPGGRWVVHRLTEGVRDPFWNPMTQSSPGVNRQNRYSQVEQAGKILPTAKFRMESGMLSYLVRGSFRAFASVDSLRLIAGPLHGETVLDSDGSPDEYRWVTHSLARYQGKTAHLEFSPLGEKPFAIVQVIDGAPPPHAVPSVTDSNEVANQIRQSQQELKQWLDGSNALTGEASARVASLLNAILQAQPNSLGTADSVIAEAQSRLGLIAMRLVAKETDLAQQTTWHSNLAIAMRDGTGINDHLLIRGNPSRPGEEVARRNLESLGGKENIFAGPGSGRLELARQLLSPENPLVARVIVNRLWHHLLGRGIAPTTDDLGVLGVPPTHPDLLDFLALHMVEDGWSLKRMIREICLSQTYQQDSRASDQAVAVDPKNDWLSHARVRRLEAEAVRDTLLAIAGQLDLSGLPVNAPSVPVHLTEFLDGRGRPGRNGPLDGMGKRSLYLEVRRNFLNPMMTTFDTPNPFSTMGRRNVSNVPAQSLILLNDPFVHQLADRWADAVIQTSADDQERIKTMMLTALGREPSSQELELVLAFLRSTDFASPRDAYRSWAHMLFNSKELLFRF